MTLDEIILDLLNLPAKTPILFDQVPHRIDHNANGTILSSPIGFQLPSDYISPQSRQDTSHRCTVLPSLLSTTLSVWQVIIVELILFHFHIDCRTTWTPNYQIQDYWVTLRLAAGTKPMGFPQWSCGPLLHRGRSGSSSLWSTTGFKPRGRYNLI